MFNPRPRLHPGVERGSVGVGAGLQGFQAAQAIGPFQRVDIIFDGQHGGRVDGFADEDAFGQLALGDEAEDLGQRPGRGVAFQPLDSAGAKDEHAVAAFAAQHLLPGVGEHIDLVPIDVLREHGGGCIGEGQALAVCWHPIIIGHAHARRGAVGGEQHVGAEISSGQVGQFAVGRGDNGGVELELLGSIGDPAFAEAFPGDGRNRTGAEHRPHRQFIGAGIAGRHDADAVRVGDAEQLAGKIDGVLQARLAEL